MWDINIVYNCAASFPLHFFLTKLRFITFQLLFLKESCAANNVLGFVKQRSLGPKRRSSEHKADLLGFPLFIDLTNSPPNPLFTGRPRSPGGTLHCAQHPWESAGRFLGQPERPWHAWGTQRTAYGQRGELLLGRRPQQDRVRYMGRQVHTRGARTRASRRQSNARSAAAAELPHQQRRRHHHRQQARPRALRHRRLYGLRAGGLREAQQRRLTRSVLTVCQHAPNTPPYPSQLHPTYPHISWYPFVF